MNESKVTKYENKSSGCTIGAILSFIGTIALAVLSNVYSGKAENERRRDPEYLAEVRRQEAEKHELAMKEAEARKQRYIYEQEKLKIDEANRKLDAEREEAANAQKKKNDALEAIKDIQDQADDMEDYELIDSAYSLLELAKDCKDEQVKYRALACMTELERQSVGWKAKQKLESIAGEIEKL